MTIKLPDPAIAGRTKSDLPESGLDEWERLAIHEAGGAEAFARLQTTTPEGLAIAPLYTAADADGLAPGFPGLAPFTRGVRATMYTQRPWTIRQYAGFSTAEETNEFFRAALAGGQTGLSVAFDLATHRGYDSDHPRVEGDVGKAGVAIDTVEDMARLFAGIPISGVSVSMTMNGAVLPVLAAFIVAAEEQGVPRAAISGTIQNDILKEFMVRNTYIYPPAPSLRIVADIIAFCAGELPKFNSISISGYHMHEAGATAVQELAFTLADGLEYARAAVARGLSIDAFAPRLSFFFAIGMNFFMEIAKLRAARTLWAQRMQKHFNPKDPRSLMLRTHCQTSGVSLTEQDPYNNIVRTAYEAMAAVLGGTQSLHTNAFDEAIALPSDAAARVARNTQLILQHETAVTQTVDPLGGSYYVERLTADLVAAADALIDDIEAKGGMTAMVASGAPKLAIEKAATERQARLDRGETVIVGVNKYRPDRETPIEVREIDNGRVRQQQIERIASVKARRDAAAVARALKALAEGAKGESQNLLTLCIEAMRARATVGEVSAALEEVFGRYAATPQTVQGVYGAAMTDDPAAAAARMEITALSRTLGHAPRLYLCKLGQDGHDRGVKIIAAAFSDLGYRVTVGPLFATPEEAARAAIRAGAEVVGISTLAGAHKTLIPQLVAELQSLTKGEGIALPRVIVGGVIPQADYAALQRAGADAIFGPGTAVPDAALKVAGLIAAARKGN